MKKDADIHKVNDIAAAYKIDEQTIRECIDFGQIARDLIENNPGIADYMPYAIFDMNNMRFEI